MRGKRRNNNINHLHKKYLESQHYKYRKRQTKAFASLRRTARHERIPPNGFWELSLGQCFQKLRGDASINVINLKRLLNGKQNVWKYQNGEEKSDSDGREKDV